jgi:hypothetical protein
MASMSAERRKADIWEQAGEVAEVPKAAVSNRSKADNLFDHVVGASEQGQRDFEAERFGGLEIDGGPVLRGKPVLVGRQVSRA